jgi:hypothetical protein
MKNKVPLRVDFAGGWLDVPKFARPGAYVVNCAISPLVSLDITGTVMSWDTPEAANSVVPAGSGLGTSAAYYLLRGEDVDSIEAAAGCGWQDAAVIRQTGLCVWESGDKPVLSHGESGEWLRGRLAIFDTGHYHSTAGLVERPRSYRMIEAAGDTAALAAFLGDIGMMAEAVEISYAAQLAEGMDRLPQLGQMAAKYCGAGWGGYAVYLFDSDEFRNAAVTGPMMAVEPHYAPGAAS